MATRHTPATVFLMQNQKACCLAHPSRNVQIMAAWQSRSRVPWYVDGWKSAIDWLERHLGLGSEGYVPVLSVSTKYFVHQPKAKILGPVATVHF